MPSNKALAAANWQVTGWKHKAASKQATEIWRLKRWKFKTSLKQKAAIRQEELEIKGSVSSGDAWESL